MIKTAKLNNLKFLLWNDNEPFHLTENDKLVINFTSEIYDLQGAIISLKNGKIRKDYTFENTPIEVDNSLLIEGRIDCLVSLKGNLKTFYLDGIIVKVLDQEYLLTSFFDGLQKEVEDHKKRLNALEEDKKTIFD